MSFLRKNLVGTTRLCRTSYEMSKLVFPTNSKVNLFPIYH
jgi:hypothetical protein